MTLTGLRTLTLTEAKLMLRDVAGLSFVLLLPLAVLVVFGLPESSRQPSEDLGGIVPINTTLPSVALLLAFGMVGFFSLPAYLGDYRKRGILRRLSTTPIRPLTLLVAQIVVNLTLALFAVVLVIAVGMSVLGMEFPKSFPWLVVSLILGITSLFSVGLLIAAVAPSAQAAQVIGHIPFWPMAFVAGMWIPKELLPDVISRIGDFTPLGAFREAVQTAWVGATPQAEHLIVLAATTVIAGVAAAKLFRWE
jgi:ABC-2 type transport system permease protein